MNKQLNTLSNILHDQLDKVLLGNTAYIHFHTMNSNLFCCMVDEALDELNFKFNLMRYRLKASEVHEPYDPFLSLLRDFINRNNIDVEELLQKANVYPAHRTLFKDYFRGILPNRKEDLIFYYRNYEISQVQSSIAKILVQLSKKTPLIIAIADIHYSDSSTLEFIQSLKKYLNKCKVLFLFCYNKNYRLTDDTQNDKWSSFINHVEDSNFILTLETHVGNLSQSPNWPSTKVYSSAKEIILASLLNLRFLVFNETIKCALKAKQILENASIINIKHYFSILEVLGDSYYYLGENDNAIIYYRMLSEEAHKRNNAQLLSDAYRKTALVHINKYDIEAASKLASQSLKIARLDNNEYQLLKVYLVFYLISDKTNNPLEKDKYFLLLDLLLKYDLEDTYAFCLKNANMYVKYYPNLDEIHSMCDKAIEFSLKNQNEYSLAVDYHKKGIIYSYSEDYKNTIYYFEKCKKIRLRLGDPLQTSQIYNGMGYIYMLTGDYRNAHRHFSKSVKLLDEIRDYNEASATLFNFALLNFLGRNYKECLKIIDKLLQIMKIFKMKYLPFRSIKDTYVLKALCHFKLGEQFKASELMSRINELSSVPLNSHYRCLYSILEGLMHAYNHEGDLAINSFEDATNHLDICNTPSKYLLPMYYFEYGLMLFSIERTSEARTVLNKGLMLSNELQFKYYKSLIESLLIGNTQAINGYILPKVNINLNAIVAIAKQEVTLNKLHKKIREIEFINKLQELSSACTSKASVAEKYLDLIYINFPAEIAYMHIFENNKWTCLAAKSTKITLDSDNMHYVNKLITENKPLLLDLSHNDNSTDKSVQAFKSIISIPIMAGKTPAANLFLAVSKSENHFTQDDLNVLTISMKQITTTFSKIDQALALLKMAKTDILTGLNNRQALQTTLNDELIKMRHDFNQQNAVLSIMFIDLDNFKYYNDTFGHNVGDLILKAFADLLRKCFRETDFIARLGGDEFVVVLPNTDEMKAKLIASRLLRLLDRNKNFESVIMEPVGHSVDIPEEKNLSCSIGISSCSYGSLQENSMNILLRNADQALYKAKDLGKNTIAIY